MMRIADVMTVDVATVEGSTPLLEVAKLMLARGGGAIPVLRDGAVIGIVCRSDVLPFEEDPDRTLRTAADVMSRDVVTLHESMTIPQAARVLARHGFKRAPVVRGARLVGIVSESDLLGPYLRPDADIRRDLLLELRAPALGTHLSPVEVSVDDGIVTLTGRTRGQAQHALILRTVRAIEGVAGLRDKMTMEPEQLGASSG